MMKKYHWKNRVLVVFSDSERVHSTRQREVIDSDAPGFAERDVVVLGLGGSGELYHDVNVDQPEVKGRYGVEDGFMVLLIGKDGTVKRVWRRPVTASEVFELIDAMPMRRSEMRRKRGV